MKTLRGLAVAAGLACASLVALSSPALAQLANPGLPTNQATFGYSETLLASTSSTTTYVNVLSVTNSAHKDPNGFSNAGYRGGSGVGSPGDGVNYPFEHLHVWWSADVTKSTSGTGRCGVFVNGALYAPSVRNAASVGGEDTMGGVLDIALSVTGPQTVSLQCSSSDTALLTVNNASLLAQEVYR